jgi:hypothetical protein
MAHQFKGFACGCCTDECLIGSDSSPTSIDKWTFESGDWSAVGGKLRGVDAGLITFSTPHPDGVTGLQHVQVTITPDAASNNTSRVRVAITDNDNYLFAEVVTTTSGCQTLQLGQRSAGSDSYLGGTVPTYTGPGDPCALSVCWQPGEGGDGELSALIHTTSGDNAYGRSYLVEEATAEGASVGLEVVTGTADFDGFAFKKHQSEEDADCPTCDPPSCLVHHETFTGRSTGTEIGCHFVESSGDWSIGTLGGIDLLTVATSSRVALCLHPGTPGRQFVYGIVRLGHDNDRARVIFDAVDGSNYHYGEVRVNDAGNQVTLAYGKVSGGGDTQLFSTTVASTISRRGILQACLRDGLIIIAFSDVSTTPIFWQPVSRAPPTNATGGKFTQQTSYGENATTPHSVCQVTLYRTEWSWTIGRCGCGSLRACL